MGSSAVSILEFSRIRQTTLRSQSLLLYTHSCLLIPSEIEFSWQQSAMEVNTSVPSVWSQRQNLIKPVFFVTCSSALTIFGFMLWIRLDERGTSYTSKESQLMVSQYDGCSTLRPLYQSWYFPVFGPCWDILAWSYYPQNAFASKLQRFNFNHFSMLVVDIMHEFELGTWKALFTHLIRVLYAVSPSGQLVAKLDDRWGDVVTVPPLCYCKTNVDQFSTDTYIWSWCHP